MNWSIIRLVYKPKGPIHIGYHKLGFIQRTRYYIPARNLWGATTSNFTKMAFDHPAADDYAETGSEIRETLRFSYFYPSLGIENSQISMPVYRQNGLKYGEYNADQFERFFIQANGHTAIDPSCMTAEDGTLHETEYISNVINKGDAFKQVYFTGYVFIKVCEKHNLKWTNTDASSSPCLKAVMEDILVGGERRYGFGGLRLYTTTDFNELSEKIFDCFQVKSDCSTDCQVKNSTQDICLKIPSGSPIPAHLAATGGIDIRGDLEPLVGWGWEKGAGEKEGKKVYMPKIRSISSEPLFWKPGSVAGKDLYVSIDPNGVLKNCKRRKNGE